MRYVILSIVMWLLANVVHAFEIEDRAVFGDETGSAPLRIVSTADISYFKPIIDAFRAFRPDVTIDYTVASSTEVMDGISREKQPFDIVISSAMALRATTHHLRPKIYQIGPFGMTWSMLLRRNLRAL
jgi:iron(III) transport system substrate-binding protein